MRILFTTGFLLGALVLSSNPAQAETPKDLIGEWSKQNSICRGRSGDDPRTLDACDIREVYGRALARVNYCYGKTTDLDGSMAKWHRCGRDSVR